MPLINSWEYAEVPKQEMRLKGIIAFSYFSFIRYCLLQI